MSADPTIRVLIADDDPSARGVIRSLLAGAPDVEVVGEAGSGAQAVEAIRTLEPSLVFLDVEMPEGDGFEVVRQVGAERMPATVFATAYNEHAVRAFEAQALDYLLKPFDDERFAAVLQRARAQLGRARAAEREARLEKLLAALTEERYATRFTLRTGARIQLVPVEQVDYITAEENYVRLHLGARSYLHREPLSRVAARLDPRRFLRIHRSTVVNLERVVELESLFAGEYVVFLRDGTRLTAGRTYRAALRDALGME